MEMNNLKLKQLLCTFLALTMLLGAFSNACAVELKSDEVIVLYENYFNGESADVTECRETGITSLSADPADPENTNKQVLKMTSKGTAPTSSEDLSSFNINIKSTGQKYSALGYDSTKPVIYEVDLYIPESTIKVDGVSYTGYDGLYVSPIYSSNNSPYYKNKVLAHTALKMGINASNRNGVIADGRLAISENRYDQNPTYAATNEWHTFKWIISAGGTSVSMWVDDTLVKTASTRYQLTDARYMDGIKISSTATNGEKTQFPEGTSIYVDNVKIYQVKEAFSGEFVYDEDDSIGTLTFNHEIEESELAKITVTDSTGNTVVPAKSLSTDGKVVTLNFTEVELGSEETYTVSVATLTDEYGLSIDVSSFTFVSAALKAEEIKVLYENYFNGESADVTECRETGITSLSADPADPENTNKQVLKMTSKGTAPTSSEDLSSFNINIKSTGQKYSALGYDSTKPVIYEVDLYIPESTIKVDGVSYTGYDGLYVSPIYSSNNSPYYKNKVLAHTALKMGINASNRNGVIADGRLAISENRYDQNPTYAATNEWHTFKWIISAGGTSVSMWVDDTLVKTASTRYQLTDARYMDGIKISSTATNGEKTQFPEGTSIYVDNVKIYQVNENFSGQFSYDADTSMGKLTLNRPITETDLDKITVTDSTGNAVVPAKSLSTDGMVVTFSFGDSLQLGETYTVSAASLTDEYGLSLDVSSFTFTEPKSRSVAIKTATITAVPSSTGATASLVLENIADSRNACIIMAVYGQYEQLLGVDTKTITVDGTTEPITFAITDDCTGATHVEVFVWDGQDTMIPLQKSEVIWTSGN